MPESPLETHELHEQLHESVEHAHGHEHGHGQGEGGGGPHGERSWIVYLSLTTAVIAVVAAIAALYAGGFANEAILEKNDAVLKKSAASDKFSEYESRKIKSHLYAVQAEALQGDKPEIAAKFRGIAKDELAKGQAPFAEARKLDAESDEKNEAAAGLLEKHEKMARAVTLFQVAIALSAIAALTRRKFMWYFSIAFGVVGVLFSAWGFGPHARHAHDEREPGPAVTSEGAPPDR